jgi:glutamine amidotransferase PdxT
MASAFHPELTSDPTVHRHFLDLVRLGTSPKTADIGR